MMSPLILIDSVGPFEAIGKSWRLTWGNAWRLVGAALLTFIPIMLVFWPAGIALGVFSFEVQQTTTVPSMPWTKWQTFAWVVLSAFVGVLATSFYLVAFRALKAAKSEGGEAASEMVPA